MFLFLRLHNDTVIFKVILHQFWVKKFFPWKFNLEYGGTFTKLFMHVSSRNMFPTIRNLQIYACLSSSPLLWRLINFRFFCSDDCRSWPCDEKINNHGCWGKHAHIPDNDYWGICLFHVVWTIFFFFGCNYSCTHGIYFYLHPTFFSSTEQCAWAIISPKELKSWVTCISFALLYGKTELSAVKYFEICT
jgi:hypothetical protein